MKQPDEGTLEHPLFLGLENRVSVAVSVTPKAKLYFDPGFRLVRNRGRTDLGKEHFASSLLKESWA